MNREQFKAQHRQNRIAANNGIGMYIGKVIQGAVAPYDNSSIWNLRNSISNEIAPVIQARQRAWANANG